MKTRRNGERSIPEERAEDASPDEPRSRSSADYSWSLLSQIGILLFGLAVQSALAWLLGPTGRGEYAIAMVFAGLMAVLFEFGTDTSVAYYVAAREMTLDTAVTAALVLAIVFGGIGALVGVAVSQLPLPFFAKASPTAFVLALAFIPLQIAYQTVVIAFTAIGRFGGFALVRLWNTILLLAAILAFAGVGKLGVDGALWAQGVSWFGAVVLGLWLLRFRSGWRLVRVGRTELGQLLGYGLRFFFGKLANRVNVQLAMIILAAFATSEEIGIFAVAIALVSKVAIVPETLHPVLLPRVAEGSESGGATVVTRVARASFVTSTLVLAVIALFADGLVNLLFSSAFGSAVPLVRILSLGLSVRFGTKIFSTYLMGVGRPGLSSIAVVAGLATNVAGIVLLYPALGLAGAAWAAVAGYVASSLLLAAWFRSVSMIPLRELAAFSLSDVAPVAREVRRLLNRYAAFAAYRR